MSTKRCGSDGEPDSPSGLTKHLEAFHITDSAEDGGVIEPVPMEIDASNAETNATNDNHTQQILQCCILLCLGVVVTILAQHKDRLDGIERDLRAEILYQDKAVDAVIETLKDKQRLQTLVLLGPTGVGKTLTANVLKRHFDSSAVFETQQHLHFKTGQNHLLIMDDLRQQDSGKVAQLIARLPNDRNILVVAIFNTQDTQDGWTFTANDDCVEHILSDFEVARVVYTPVQFNVLDSADLTDWLKSKLRRRNIPEHRQARLVEMLVDESQVARKGFKGVEANMALVLRDV